MERQVKERLVGAAVIVAIAVILIPELLSGPSSSDKPAVTQIRDEQGIKTYEFQLDRVGQSTGALKNSTQTPPPEQSMPTAKEPAEAARSRSEATVALQQSKPVEAKPPSTPPAPTSNSKPTSSAPAVQAPAPKPLSAREAANTPGWAVQLGSFADGERATKLAARMRAAGHNAYLVPLRRPDGKVLQRVRIGPYPERSAAEAALARVAGEVKGAAIVAQP